MPKMQLKYIVPLFAAILSLPCSAAEDLRATAESPLYEPLIAEASLPRSPDGGRVKSVRLLSLSSASDGQSIANGVQASLGGTAKHPLALLSTKTPFYEPRSTIILELSYEKAPPRAISILIEPRAPAYYFAPPSLRPSLGLLAAPTPAVPPASPLPPIPELSPSAAPAPAPATTVSVANSRFIWAPWLGLAGVFALAFAGASALRRRRLANPSTGVAEAEEIDEREEHEQDAGDFEPAGRSSAEAGAPSEADELDRFDLGSIGSQSGIQMELALLYAKMGDEDSARDIISDIMASNEFADARPSARRLLSILDK